MFLLLEFSPGSGKGKVRFLKDQLKQTKTELLFRKMGNFRNASKKGDRKYRPVKRV